MYKETNVLITGATGFIGRHLLFKLIATPQAVVTASLRNQHSELKCRALIVGDSNEHTNWSDALHGQCVVVHCAVRAHMLGDEAADPLSEYR